MQIMPSDISGRYKFLSPVSIFSASAVSQTLFSPVSSYFCFAWCWCSSTRREGSYYLHARSMKEWAVVSTAQYIKQTNKQNPWVL